MEVVVVRDAEEGVEEDVEELENMEDAVEVDVVRGSSSWVVRERQGR